MQCTALATIRKVRHGYEVCKKAGQKLNALSGVTPYMDLSKSRILLNTFFISQFSYCQLV